MRVLLSLLLLSVVLGVGGVSVGGGCAAALFGYLAVQVNNRRYKIGVDVGDRACPPAMELPTLCFVSV